MRFKKLYILLSILTMTTSATVAQMTLEECYQRARQNYPMIRQRDLIEKTKDYSLQNASRGYLPTIAINGQQSYQSDVTKVPSIPDQNITIPSLSKNQYKAYADVNLNLYDGGAIRHEKQIHVADARVNELSLEVELYQLKQRINQLYFGVLMIDGQTIQQNLLIADLESGLKKTEASIANGAALKSSADILRAELLNTKQRLVELNASRTAYISMLSLMINNDLDEETVFDKPNALKISNELNRPELTLYDAQTNHINIEQKALNSTITPKLSTYLQAGYGRPGLNMLDPNADTYYIAGFRLNWNLSGLYTLKKKKQLLEIKQSSINLQRETFVFNSSYEKRQQAAEIKKLEQLAATDDEIIALRTKVKQTSSVQLENGVIDTNDYLHEVNAENLARQNKVIHEIQLLLALYTLQTTNGI